MNTLSKKILKIKYISIPLEILQRKTSTAQFISFPSEKQSSPILIFKTSVPLCT